MWINSQFSGFAVPDLCFQSSVTAMDMYDKPPSEEYEFEEDEEEECTCRHCQRVRDWYCRTKRRGALHSRWFGHTLIAVRYLMDSEEYEECYADVR